MMFTVGSLFSGIGGLDLAAHWAGFETAWFVEKEPFCQKVLAKHWPNLPIYDDVFNVSYPPSVDVIVGGFPCQPFSSSGRRQGKKDKRYLLPQMLRIVDEVKPYAVLFENVSGFPRLDHGDGFKYLLGALAEMGFDAEWGHLFASDVGAPQARERWFCVAYANGESVRRERRAVGNATSQARESHVWGNVIGSSETSRTNRNGDIKPRLGRNAHGLPCRLDFIGWPAGRGQRQYTYEPPRLATETATTEARQITIGNSVSPQLAFEIFETLMCWLTESIRIA